MALSTLPYYSAEAVDPQFLPRREEIESSGDVLVDYTGRKVVGVGSLFIVKYGVAVDLLEGQNMLFISQNTSVRVPKIHALYNDPTDKKNYIIMERAGGSLLSTVWPSLTPPQKSSIASKLKSAFDELRELPSPHGYCSIENRPLQDSIFWTGTDESLNGPFDTEDALNRAMIKKYLFNNLPKEKAVFYERALPQVLHNHRPIFTHGDLQRKNILVEGLPSALDADNVTEGGDLKIALLDWETAGWYPSYWEYSRAMLGCGRWDDDWHFWLGKILDEYLTEWAWVDMMLKELWS
jgi:hypothetical protein